MPLLLLDALDPADAAALRAHMAGGCTRCAAHLAEADALLAHLPYALERSAPASSARERLLDRIRQTNPARVREGDGASARRRVLKMPGWARATLPAAAAACLVFVLTVQWMMHLQRNREASMKRDLADARSVLARMKQVNTELGAQARLVQLLTSSSKQITLVGRDQSKAFGRAVWDEKRQVWHFRVFNLAPPPKEAHSVSPTAYELWFETPYGRKVPTPRTFLPDEHGDAYIVVSLPRDVGPVSKAFVTDEPSVGTFQPTGAVHLYGKIE